MKREQFIQAFQRQYGGYICVSNEAIGLFYDTFYLNFRHKDCRRYTDEVILDMCRDYILSQSLAEDVVL